MPKFPQTMLRGERLFLLPLKLFLMFLLCCSMSGMRSYAQIRSSELKADFFAEISANRDSLVVGDSCVVSVVLYSNLPFESVEQTPRKIQFPKDLRVTLLSTERTQQQVRTARGVYYALVWQHYRVSRNDVGRIVWPQQQFTAELGIYEVIDDGFGGFFSFAPTMRLVDKRKAKCKTPKFSLPVVEGVKRSTQDLLRSGRQVM